MCVGTLLSRSGVNGEPTPFIAFRVLWSHVHVMSTDCLPGVTSFMNQHEAFFGFVRLCDVV